jgi:hypothetical protein
MATPHQMFAGKAPVAMARMGEGIAEAYGNVGKMMAETGKIEGQGYASLGQSIGNLAQNLGSAYGDYKKMGSSIKASENFYQSMKEGGYLPQELSKSIDSTVGSEAYKNMSTYEKAQIWDQMKSVTGSAIGQHFQMQQIGAKEGAATGRTVIETNAANQRNADTLANALERERLQGSISLLTNPSLIKTQQAASFSPQQFSIGTSAGNQMYQQPLKR